jgi:UDP-N-acetyl-D-galactosamine dehydrogenase
MTENFPSQVAVVGLGYVGLPLAAAFSRVLPTIGFDINEDRITELRNGFDRNREVDKDVLARSPLDLTCNASHLGRASFIVVAVPTPINKAKRPDLTPLIEASRLVGKHLKRKTTVVYESTIYPGCTEEVCIPVLEQESGLKSGLDF